MQMNQNFDLIHGLGSLIIPNLLAVYLRLAKQIRIMITPFRIRHQLSKVINTICAIHRIHLNERFFYGVS